MKEQISYPLPRKAWDGVVINENYEPLVEIEASEHIILGDEKHSRGIPYYWVRRNVASKLIKVASLLPDDLKLVLIEGYRTLASQQESWDIKFTKLKSEHPDWSDEAIEKQVRLVVAKPLPLANHHCGGAVDVTLAYQDGTRLDMGTSYPAQAHTLDIQKKYPMFPRSQITPEHATNRRLLREAMQALEFVYYPGEWWHYCFGDRMWAVYGEKTKCGYGPVELQDDGTTIFDAY